MEQRPNTGNARRDTSIVIVADLTLSFSLVTTILQMTPYEVFFASEHYQALELLKFIIPHLFILDYELPGMNGIEVYDLLHAVEGLAAIPAIILSDGDLRGYKEITNRGLVCVMKPVKPDRLISSIQHQLCQL